MARFLFVCLLVVFPLPAAATITYTAQIRQVAAAAGPYGGFSISDVDTAPNFLPWLGSASIDYADANGGSSSSADQFSVLGATSITNSGNLFASADTSYVASASNSFSTSFTLAGPTPYVSSLSGLAPKFFSLQFVPGGPTFAANSSGILPAGNYTLTIQFQLSAGPFSSSNSGSYQYALLVPEPASSLLGAIGGAALGAVALGRRFRRSHCRCRCGQLGRRRAQ